MTIAMTATYFERVRTFESRAAFEDFMEDYSKVNELLTKYIQGFLTAC